MFNLFKKQDWKNSSAHLLLLSKFRNQDFPERYYDDENWHSVLKEKPILAINRYLDEGFLEQSDLNHLLEYKFKLTELKAKLKERNLKVSGCKSDLIQRLIENDIETMQKAVKGLILYNCTLKGQEITKNYLDSEDLNRLTAEKEYMDFFEKKEFGKAVNIFVKFENSQVFKSSMGIGIDWDNYDVKNDVESLKLIYHKTPGILHGIKEDQLFHLRRAGAMMLLWGSSIAKNYLPADFDTGINLDGDIATRMFVYYTSYMHEMRSYRSSSVKTVGIFGCEDECTCEECKKIRGKKFKIDDVPELPYARCTCEFGCRCWTSPVDYFK